MTIVFLLIFSFFAYISRSALGIVLASVIGIYFYKKKIVRCVITVIVTFLLLLVFNGVVTAVGIYLPSLISGLILCCTYRLSFKTYSIVTTVLLALVSAAEFLLVTVFMMGTSIVESVAQTFEKYNILSAVSDNLIFSVVLYVFLLCTIMSVMKMFIAHKTRSILEKKIPHLDKIQSL